MTTAHSRLAARDLTLGYEGKQVLSGLDLTVPEGEVTVIVGPNACGKSTLLRGLARLLAPSEGSVLLDGGDIHRLPTREVARRLALLPQQALAPPGLTVAELVLRGRLPRQGIFGRTGLADDEAVSRALTLTATHGLASRPVDDLSGGQRQRVWIAMALAQETDLLLLDEPTTFLDVAHQIEVIDVVTQLNERRGTTCVLVLHDLTTAVRAADHLVVMQEGGIVAAGPPAEILTEELIAQVFGISARILPDPLTGGPLVVPLRRIDRTEES